MTGWSFWVLGSPAPQGSKSGFVNPRNGRVILKESSDAVKPWRQSVVASAMGAPRALDGAIVCRMVFTVARPKSAPKRLTYPSTMPDLSKLCRSTEDAMTTAGVWADDARVCEYTRLAKVWPGFDPESLPVPGAVVAAVEREGDWLHLLHGLFEDALVLGKRRVRGATEPVGMLG